MASSFLIRLFLFVSFLLALSTSTPISATESSASSSSSLTTSSSSSSSLDFSNGPVLPPEGCTAILVGPSATDGGSMTTHTNDCKDCDFRLSLVPAADHAPGSMRDIHPSRFAYPRYVGYERGEALKPEYVDTSIYPWPATPSIGQIPQVPHTYSYIDGGYAIINENQVAMGESTCAARLVSKPIFDGGKALFDVSELGRIALERSKTAREAIQIMGDLAEQYGYYGAEWEGPMAKGESGEAFTVTDPNEAWIFHILPDDTGVSAVWAAQRIPDDHISVVANAFIIGEIDLNQPDWFMASKNIYDVATRNNFWQPEDGPFHFSKIYGCRIFFEVYCSRRMWRIFQLAAPSLVLNSSATVAELPISVKPERVLHTRDIMEFQRDHYEGTEYDLTKGLAAGPFGNPNRYDRGAASGMNMTLLMQGTFERAISLFRTAYSFVTQCRKELPREVGAVVWFGQAIPHSTFYAPLYPFSAILPAPYSVGSLYAFDRNSIWWAVTAIGNYMERAFSVMNVDVKSAQADIELDQIAQAAKVEEKATQLLKDGNSDQVKSLLTNFQAENSARTTASWWALFEHLMTKYHDGYRLDDFHAQTIIPKALFYPLEWLKAVGFFPHEPDFTKTTWIYSIDAPLSTHPHPAQTSSNVEMKNGGDDQHKNTATSTESTNTYPAPNIQAAADASSPVPVKGGSATRSVLMTAVVSSLVFAGVGVMVGRKWAMAEMRTESYDVMEN